MEILLEQKEKMMFMPGIGVKKDLEKILEPKVEYHPVPKKQEEEEWHDEHKIERNKFKLTQEEIETEIHFIKNRVKIGKVQI